MSESNPCGVKRRVSNNQSRAARFISQYYRDTGVVPDTRTIASALEVSEATVGVLRRSLIKHGFLVRLFKGNYDIGPEMFKAERRRGVMKALEDKEMLKSIMGNFDDL